MSADRPSPTAFVAIGVGVATFAFGAAGAWRALGANDARIEFASYLVGFDLIHDIVLAPLTCVFGWFVIRHAPRRWRIPFAGAVVASLAVLAVAWLPLRHSAASKGNATFQPLNYGTSTLTAVVGVWMIALVWGFANELLDRRREAAQQVVDH